TAGSRRRALPDRWTEPVLRRSCQGPAQIERAWELGMRRLRRDLHRSDCVADGEEARQTPPLRLVGVDREGLEVSAAGMRHMIGGAADRPTGPSVDDIEHQRRMDRNGWMKARPRLPSPEAYPAD